MNSSCKYYRLTENKTATINGVENTKYDEVLCIDSCQFDNVTTLTLINNNCENTSNTTCNDENITDYQCTATCSNGLYVSPARECVGSCSIYNWVNTTNSYSNVCLSDNSSCNIVNYNKSTETVCNQTCGTNQFKKLANVN